MKPVFHGFSIILLAVLSTLSSTKFDGSMKTWLHVTYGSDNCSSKCIDFTNSYGGVSRALVNTSVRAVFYSN